MLGVVRHAKRNSSFNDNHKNCPKEIAYFQLARNNIYQTKHFI